MVVAGTGTDVGKTWLACQLVGHLRRRGLVVAARKPAQSFASGAGVATDADLLAEATGEKATDVCPAWRWYPKALAPPMAAESMGLAPFSLDELLGEVSWPEGADVGLVELAGGIGSPMASDGDGVDTVQRLSPDRVVLVASAGLGTLSNIGLALRALGDYPEVAVYLNRFDGDDETHAANRRWLGAQTRAMVSVDVTQLSELLVAP